MDSASFPPGVGAPWMTSEAATCEQSRDDARSSSAGVLARRSCRSAWYPSLVSIDDPSPPSRGTSSGSAAAPSEAAAAVAPSASTAAADCSADATPLPSPSTPPSAARKESATSSRSASPSTGIEKSWRSGDWPVTSARSASMALASTADASAIIAAAFSFRPLRRGTGSPPSATRLRPLFQWFLIALSVRPGRNLAISAHLLPSSACFAISMSSSSCDHASFRIAGSSWLCHLSRHCLPLRPGRYLAISAQRLAPSTPRCSATSRRTVSSSSCVQGRCRAQTNTRAAQTIIRCACGGEVFVGGFGGPFLQSPPRIRSAVQTPSWRRAPARRPPPPSLRRVAAQGANS
jgi:hypothetical protein